MESMTQPAAVSILGMLAGVIGVITLVAVNALFLIWMERKVSAHMQLRPGPMEVGWHGSIQTIADALKLMGKELITPKDVDRWVYLAAPCRCSSPSW
jgi:NADH-quinone oxidoreductase subunit H